MTGLPSLGQEALLGPSATQPSPQTLLYRQQARYYYGKDANNNQLALPVSISLGVIKAHSVSISTAGNFSNESSGLSDINISWKWRFHSKNTGPLNTSRTALISSLQIPTGGEGWSTQSFNPSLGIAHTSIIDRWGLGLFAEYKFNTGSGARYNITGLDSTYDTGVVGGSVLYRISPKKFKSDTRGALYGVVESQGVVNQAGASIQIGPGIMYEAETWVVELGWQFYPVSTGDMPQVSGMGIAGFRLFF